MNTETESKRGRIHFKMIAKIGIIATQLKRLILSVFLC